MRRKATIEKKLADTKATNDGRDWFTNGYEAALKWVLNK